LNYFQPQIAEAVTKEGFMHIKLPSDTYKWLKEWYDKAKQVEEIEESSSGSCMNQAVAPSSVTHIAPDEKRRLAAELKVTSLVKLYFYYS
jgi:hypothetical protein